MVLCILADGRKLTLFIILQKENLLGGIIFKCDEKGYD